MEESHPMPRRMIGLLLFLFCLTSHLWAMARINLPSQDGLKFISIAQAFTRQPAWEVIRSADQHPLYPASIALFHAMLNPFSMEPHISWRLAAQVVSMIAAIATLWPLYAITGRLYRPTISLLAVLIWLALPLPLSLGHETLSDSLALCFVVWALYCGILAADSHKFSRRLLLAFATGMLVSAGYWTRPESLIAGLSISLLWLTNPSERISTKLGTVTVFASVAIPLTLLYLTINGTFSDRFVALTQSSPGHQLAPTGFSHLPKGLPEALRDPRLDFSPKDPAREVSSMGLKAGLASVLRLWAESLGDGMAVMTLWGLLRCRTHSSSARRLFTIQTALLVGVLTYQATSRGYLSSRHAIGLTFLSVPHAAAAIRLCALRFAGLLRLSARRRRVGTRLVLSAICAGGIWVQAKPIHASRQGHHAAGLWLESHASKSSAIFDTRGWASFQADLKRYDPYHVSQALSDSRTSYWVLEAGELASGSRRAATLAKILEDGGELVAKFPKKQGRDDDGDVLVFAWKRPDWWDRPSSAHIARNRPAPSFDPSVEKSANREHKVEQRRP